MSEPATLGADFVRALAEKDSGRMLGLMRPDIDFRAMTPNRVWEASDRDEVIAVILGHWFAEQDEITEIESIDIGGFGDRQRVGYRFSVACPDGRFLVEQQAYLSERDGRIEWMRVLCSGFRPA
jgi:hypothetical protein